jgi:hypothetical protein
MNTVTRGCFGTFWGRRLVPGRLNVPALDRYQSPLPFPFTLCYLVYPFLSLYERVATPARSLSFPPFLSIISPLLYNLSVPRLCALYPAFLYARRPNSTLCCLPTLPCFPHFYSLRRTSSQFAACRNPPHFVVSC